MSKKRLNIVLVVAEKPKAAEKISYALAGGKSQVKIDRVRSVRVWVVKKRDKIYRVTGTGGHLYTTEFARDIHERPWRDIDPRYLLTIAPVVKIVRGEARNIVNVIREEVKKAGEIIIATDYDREGENIGMQVAELIAKKINPRVKIRRAIFSSLTKRELTRAFMEENLGRLDKRKIDASEVRQELDLRYGVAFTRLATMKLHQRIGNTGLPLLSIGPCQTPTLGLIVDKYMKHLESKKRAEKEKKHHIYLVASFNGLRLKFVSKREFNSKKEALTALKSVNGELRAEIIDQRRVKLARPLPLNTPRLAEIAAKYLKLSSYKTLKLAEKLYLEGLISYPRTETDRYSNNVLSYVYKVFDEMRRKKFLDQYMEVSKPRQGRRDDHAHPPIHPTKFIDPRKIKKSIGPKARELYELICRHFAANFMRDAELIKYKIRARDHLGNEYQAEAVIPDELGFLKIYKYQKIRNMLQDTKPEFIETLNKINMKVIEKGVMEKTPQIAKPISESELVKLMDKLGIGTDATFAEHIRKNIDRGYVIRKEGRLIPTKYGLAIAKALKEIVPEVIDPRIRAEIESYFKAVEEGKMSRKEAIREAIRKFTKLYDKFYKNIDKFINEVLKGAEETGIHTLRKLRHIKRKTK